MKKILVCLIALILLLPIISASAAERTTVDVAAYNNISEKLLVSVITTDNAFEGATIEVGDSISYTLSGNGKGTHTAAIDLSSLSQAGEMEVVVTASYGGDDTDTITKNVTITKMDTSKTNYSIINLDLSNISTTGSGNCNIENVAPDGSPTDDEGAMRISWGTPFVSETTRINMNFGAGANTANGIYVIEHDVMFQNGTSTEKEIPNMKSAFVFFRTTSASEKPIYSNGKAWNDTEVRSIFAANGVMGNGESYTTNVWYRLRYVIDKYTLDDEGNLVGGLNFYIATADDDGNFGDFKLFKKFDYVVMPALTIWRYEFKSETGDAVMNIKNMSFTRHVPVDSWYVNNIDVESEKATVEFSEDMGELDSSSFKLLNQGGAGDEIEIASVSNLGNGMYELLFKNELFSNMEYALLVKNGLKSADNAKAFNEPEEDENGDGFWKVEDFTAPGYALNIIAVEELEQGVEISFTNDNVEGKYIIALWYDANGAMVDYVVSTISADTQSPLALNRTNSEAAETVLTYVIDADESGAINVYDIN